MYRIVLLMSLLAMAHCDLYLHNPRGSNNRLHEKTATRTNANRMFDSQNNNRGGYNVGDKTDQAAGNNANNQYQMSFFQSAPGANRVTGERGTHLTIEWTNQHGLGGNEDTDPQKQNANMVLQYICQDDTTAIPSLNEQMRDGTSTQTITYTKPGSKDESNTQVNNRKKNNLNSLDRGLQESWEFYDKCYMRSANLGLFIADQKVKKNKFNYRSAAYTRQNPNGNRYGYECPEERDYFPYWHPTQWKDIAILAENSSMCSHYQSKSFNVQPYHECVEFWPSGQRKHWSQYNNEQECTANEGKWILFYNYLEKAPAYTSKAACESRSGTSKYIWALPYDAKVSKDSDLGNHEECLVALETPDCYEAPWSRSNHLGNGRNDPKALTYTWVLPHFPSGNEYKCVYRMRYNISTDDYDPYHTNASHNENKKLDIKSPVQDNTLIDVGGPVDLQMALNTDQTGRIFQDRSHLFRLVPRVAEMGRSKIFNLNSRGKRGNIVQVYPAVEYDFTPNDLRVGSNDLVHIQWTGSNTHNNGGGGGDGQAGDDGEGTGGTDRINMAQIHDRNDNIPMPFEQTTMWENAQIIWIHHGKKNVSPRDLAVDLASSSYYSCFYKKDCPELSDYIVETKTKLQNQLNNAPASYAGVVLKFKKGTYNYMCTRNNNFTNRSNKGTIHVQ